MNKKLLAIIFSVLCSAQGMLASDKPAFSLQVPQESLEDIQNEFDFDGVEPNSPRSTVLYGRHYASPSRRYVPSPRGSRSPIITKPYRPSVPSPLLSVQEECNSFGYASDSDDEISQDSLSPRKRSESLVYAITTQEFDDAGDIIKDMVYEGRFSPSIAEVAGNALRSLSLVPTVYKNISKKDNEQSVKQANDMQRLVSIINSGRRASPIVESAFQQGGINQCQLEAIDARVNRILKANN